MDCPRGPWVSWERPLREKFENVLSRFTDNESISEEEFNWLKSYTRMHILEFMEAKDRPEDWDIRLSLLTSPEQLLEYLAETEIMI